MQKVCLDDPKIIYEPVRKPSGHFIINGNQVADTLRCCHCNHTWAVIRGSGIERGFCRRCMSATCGNPTCDPCIPWEMKLDLMEKHKWL